MSIMPAPDTEAGKQFAEIIEAEGALFSIVPFTVDTRAVGIRGATEFTVDDPTADALAQAEVTGEAVALRVIGTVSDVKGIRFSRHAIYSFQVTDITMDD